MRSDNKRSKRTGFIDRRLYRKIITRCTMHWVIFVATAGLLGLMIQFCADPFAGWKTNVRVFWSSFGSTVAVSICLIPIFVSDFLKLIHRSVGLLVRVSGALQTMADGKLPEKLTCREDDFNSQLADDINALIEMLAETRGEFQATEPSASGRRREEKQLLELESVGH